jgi:hypothetical protein
MSPPPVHEREKQKRIRNNGVEVGRPLPKALRAWRKEDCMKMAEKQKKEKT